jgi:hypothetical protein
MLTLTTLSKDTDISRQTPVGETYVGVGKEARSVAMPVGKGVEKYVDKPLFLCKELLIRCG